MSVYRVRFASVAGEVRRDVLVDADRFDISGSTWRFHRGPKGDERTVAVVPDERVLIIQEEDTVEVSD